MRTDPHAWHIGPSGVALMGFLRDSAVDAEVIERSSQRLRQTPETRLHQPPKGMTFTNQQFAGRSVGLLGRLHPSG